MTQLKVLSVASEIFPLIKTGGLADVVGALPGALAREDVATITLVPGYPALLAKLDGGEPVRRYDRLFGGPATLLAAAAGSLKLFVLDAPHLFMRPGNPYLGPDGRDWPDNALRFAALARVGADIGKARRRALRPTSCMPMIGRRRWRRPICITTAARGRRRSSPSTTSPSRAISPRTCSRPCDCRRSR